MRYLFVILIFLLPFNASTQDSNSIKKFPFQVLYAEDARNNEGKILKSLDVISADDILTVGKKGMLLLIHYSGLPIETEGDTTLVVEVLQKTIVVSGEKTKSKNKYLSPSPDLSRLFIKDGKLAAKNKRSDCLDCESKIEIVYPPRLNTIVLEFSGDLCLSWAHSAAKSYQVQIKNVFEDVLYTTNVPKNEFQLDSEELKRIKGKEINLLIVITDSENTKYSDPILLSEFRNSSLEFPYACTIQKASSALITGLYIETLPSNYRSEAEKYFIRATELSDWAFYKEMLTNFKQRTEQ